MGKEKQEEGRGDVLLYFEATTIEVKTENTGRSGARN
jgi:hypothetical protein